MSKTEPVIAYHFTGDRLRDGLPIPEVGKWLTCSGPVKMCESGLHASRQPFDALTYAPGPMLHMVEVADIVDEEGDKLVCRRRRIIRSGDATEMLRYFARMQALSVIHLWDAPGVVCDYLMTGDEGLRAAAWAAARDAAWAAARDAARDAAWAAARDAARDAAWAAAWAAVRAATWDAARDATWDAAWAAARAAAWAAARDAAWAAARDAARDAQREHFNNLVAEFFHAD